MKITYKLKGSDEIFTVYIESGSNSDVEVTVNGKQAIAIFGVDVKSVMLDDFGVDLISKPATLKEYSSLMNGGYF